MFVSLPEHRFQVPEGLATPGAAYWRSLAVSTNAPWYILNLCIGPGTLVDTFLLVWDTDLLHAIQAEGVKADSLQLLLRRQRGPGWQPVEIREIWEAVDLEDESDCVLLVDVGGKEYSGYFMETVRRVKRVRLVATLRTGSSARGATND